VTASSSAKTDFWAANNAFERRGVLVLTVSFGCARGEDIMLTSVTVNAVDETLDLMKMVRLDGRSTTSATCAG
jgi:hypothetical protein